MPIYFGWLTLYQVICQYVTTSFSNSFYIQPLTQAIISILWTQKLLYLFDNELLCCSTLINRHISNLNAALNAHAGRQRRRHELSVGEVRLHYILLLSLNLLEKNVKWILVVSTYELLRDISYNKSVNYWIFQSLSYLLYVRLFVWLPVCLSDCLSVCLSVCLSMFLSIVLSVCLSVYLVVFK